jgi:hypothetical protein
VEYTGMERVVVTGCGVASPLGCTPHVLDGTPGGGVGRCAAGG